MECENYFKNYESQFSEDISQTWKVPLILSHFQLAFQCSFQCLQGYCIDTEILTKNHFEDSICQMCYKSIFKSLPKRLQSYCNASRILSIPLTLDYCKGKSSEKELYRIVEHLLKIDIFADADFSIAMNAFVGCITAIS